MFIIEHDDEEENIDADEHDEVEIEPIDIAYDALEHDIEQVDDELDVIADVTDEHEKLE